MRLQAGEPAHQRIRDTSTTWMAVRGLAVNDMKGIIGRSFFRVKKFKKDASLPCDEKSDEKKRHPRVI